MRSPRHATVVAYAALVIALSGSAYAAATIGSPQIKDNSIRSVDVKNGGLAAGDLSAQTRAALSGLPNRTRLVRATGAPVANGNQLRAALAGLPNATTTAPWTVRLGPGRYALDGPGRTFAVPDNVTLVGDGPLTRLETTATNSVSAVVDLAAASVVRSVTVVNPSSTAGATGIDGTGAPGSLITDVVVDALDGVVLEGSRLRDADILASGVGVRVLAGDASELDNVTVDAGGFISSTGVVLAGPARLDGVDATSSGSQGAIGLLVTAASGTIEVRDSSFRGTGVLTSGSGLSVNPPSTSTARVFVDGSRAIGNSSGSGAGLRTDGSGALTRVGSSVLGGSASVIEANGADARCIDSHDDAYATAVTC